ncbi:MAG TPA: hypothetical protein VJN94_17375 [Candidatus Binataceae bacterium]|nr:hypothetical protein [Candidatus Binataceae bacterium]
MVYFANFYLSIARAAFAQTVDYTNRVQLLPDTFLLAVIVAILFALQTRPRAMRKFWKDVITTGLAVIILFSLRFVWNSMNEIVTRQRVADVAVTETRKWTNLKISELNARNHRLKDQLRDQGVVCLDQKDQRAKSLAANIDGIEKENFPQQLFDARAAMNAAHARTVQAQTEYDNCRKTAGGCPGLFGNMEQIEQEEKQTQMQFEMIETSLNSQLNDLRNR